MLSANLESPRIYRLCKLKTLYNILDVVSRTANALSRTNVAKLPLIERGDRRCTKHYMKTLHKSPRKLTAQLQIGMRGNVST